jgi:17beta-estradiol 17-dehydrogenase / very-long-chain 3-oxoacyl-CoA reductase
VPPQLFSQSLNAEYKKQGIHVQVQTPLFVATKLAKIKKASLTVPSPAGYARAAVRFIGYEDSISPYWSHALQLHIMSLMPRNVLAWIVYDMHAGLRKKGLKKAQKST